MEQILHGSQTRACGWGGVEVGGRGVCVCVCVGGGGGGLRGEAVNQYREAPD